MTDDVKKILATALENTIGKKIDFTDIADLDAILKKNKIRPELYFAEAALSASQNNLSNQNKGSIRSTIQFQTSSRSKPDIIYTESDSVKWYLEPKTVKDCVVSTNKLIDVIYHITLLYDVDIFDILGMRNLSSFIGELFAKELHSFLKDRCIPNPNQDGYPDLCALTPEGNDYVNKHLGKDGERLANKEFWTFYSYGGIEVKATCGNTPAASKMRKLDIGESRLSIMVSAEWKAHHQKTKTLLGIYWDFVEGIPTVLAVFFRNDLDTSVGSKNRDWGTIIKPKEGGGRTTSVSIMKRGRTDSEGVKKMGKGWMVLPCDKKYLDPISKIFCIKLKPLKTKLPASFSL